MDATAPTTPQSSYSSSDDIEESSSDVTHQVLTNGTLLNNIFRFHTEIRVRMVAVKAEDTTEAIHFNRTTQRAMDRITQRHPRTYHTTVIRDYRPQHLLIEKLISPDIVYGLLLTNYQVRYAVRAATISQRMTHGLFYQHDMSENVKGLRPRLPSTSPFCPLPVQDLLEDESLQMWTSIKSSQQEILALDVGEYQ